MDARGDHHRHAIVFLAHIEYLPGTAMPVSGQSIDQYLLFYDCFQRSCAHCSPLSCKRYSHTAPTAPPSRYPVHRSALCLSRRSVLSFLEQFFASGTHVLVNHASLTFSRSGQLRFRTSCELQHCMYTAPRTVVKHNASAFAVLLLLHQHLWSSIWNQLVRVGSNTQIAQWEGVPWQASSMRYRVFRHLQSNMHYHL